MTRPPAVADALRFHPAPDAHRVAIRAATVMLLALLALWAAGRLEWSLYATFGTFASVYGGQRPRPRRWRVQAALGVLLTSAVATGAVTGLSSHRSWVAVPVAACWAAVAAALSDRFEWRPPGPLFPVFAVAACASVPTAAADVAPAVCVAAATAAAAVGLGALEVGLSKTSPAPVASGTSRAVHPPHRRVIHAVRCCAAVLVAGVIATASGIGHPYWAMVASVAPLAAPTLRSQLLRGAQRTVGTTLGVLVAAALLSLSYPEPLLILLVAALQGSTELLVTRNYAAALVFLTPLALLLTQLATHQAVTALVLDRLLETVIGVVVGVAVAVVTRDQRSRP